MTDPLENIGKLFLTIDEAADICRCHRDTVRRAIRDGRLATYKLSGKHGQTLIRIADFKTWLQRSRIAAIGEQ